MTVHGWVKGELIPSSYPVKFCEIVIEDTMLQVLKSNQLLELHSLADYRGNTDKPLVLPLIRIALEHEELRNIVLRR